MMSGFERFPQSLQQRVPVEENSENVEFPTQYPYNAELIHRPRPKNPLRFANVPPQDCAAAAYSDDGSSARSYVCTGVTVVSLIAENLLCHPFVVLRRQCQVHDKSNSYHLVPVTLLPVIYNLHQRQGLTSLCKGLGSVLLVRGLTVGVEDLLSKITPWQKEVSWYCSVKDFLQHLILKCVSLAIITPFYSASLVETVQSDIASEKPGIFDVFKEGLMRVVNCCGGSKGRMLPLWSLIVPTVGLGICRYIFSIAIRNSADYFMHAHFRKDPDNYGRIPKDPTNQIAIQEIELTASLISTIGADVVFFPFETILHRLHLQGTRTIIDNLDTGRSVLPILTNYEGIHDCIDACMKNEGFFGFYKGFGALILQYAVHLAVIRLTRVILTQAMSMLRMPPKVRSVEHSPPIIPNVENQGAYLLP